MMYDFLYIDEAGGYTSTMAFINAAAAALLTAFWRPPCSAWLPPQVFVLYKKG